MRENLGLFVPKWNYIVINSDKTKFYKMRS